MKRLLLAAAVAGLLSAAPVASHHGGAAFTNEGVRVQVLNPTNGLPPGWSWAGGPFHKGLDIL
jgi:hypothetical protein